MEKLRLVRKEGKWAEDGRTTGVIYHFSIVKVVCVSAEDCALRQLGPAKRNLLLCPPPVSMLQKNPLLALPSRYIARIAGVLCSFPHEALRHRQPSSD